MTVSSADQRKRQDLKRPASYELVSGAKTDVLVMLAWRIYWYGTFNTCSSSLRVSATREQDLSFIRVRL